MCRPTRCKQCGKTTWAGCGQHIAAVKASVPDDQWCPGHPGGHHESPSGNGFLGRLLGK